jgi:hypothetical protein
MKQLLFILLFASSLMGLSSCKKDASNGKTLVNFINKTGAKIEGAKADNIEIGSIADNGQTGYIRFDKFGIDTEMPDCNFTGILNNNTLQSTSRFYWCGTEKSGLKPGQYNIEVTVQTSGSTNYFDLHFK